MLADRHASAGARNTALKQGSPIATLAVDLLPPLTVVAVVLIWMLAPSSITENPWSVVIAGLTTSFFLLGLEFLFERHEDWRLNWREFATDLFYFVLMYSVIGWAVEALADGPLAENGGAKLDHGSGGEVLLRAA